MPSASWTRARWMLMLFCWQWQWRCRTGRGKCWAPVRVRSEPEIFYGDQCAGPQAQRRDPTSRAAGSGCAR